MDELEDLPILHVDSQQDEKIRTQLTIHLLAGFETAFYRLRPETCVDQIPIELTLSFQGVNDVAPLLSVVAGGEEDVCAAV